MGVLGVPAAEASSLGHLWVPQPDPSPQPYSAASDEAAQGQGCAGVRAKSNECAASTDVRASSGPRMRMCLPSAN